MNTSAQTQQTKTCTKCGASKPSSEFGVDTRRKDGHKSWCKACYAAHKRELYQSCPDYRAYHSAYKCEHREHFRTYKRKRYHSDPDFHVICQIRHMVRRVLRATSTKKTSSSEKLLGYSVEELRTHLESQFEPGMTWDDRDAWHIDHVKPVSAFIAEGIKDPQVINALSNLRPLWAKDNLAKGARY